MDIEVIKITVGPISENCYIVKTGEGKAALIDPGAGGERLSAELEKHGLSPEKILLTHGHFDHIGAAAFLKEKYHIPVYISEKDECMLNDGEKSGAVIAPFMEFNPVAADYTFKDGDEIEIGDLKAVVLETPGHSAGSVCFIIGDCIFAGDTIFRGSAGRTDLYSGDFREQEKSLEKLSKLKGSFRLYCGHGADSTLDEEKQFNPYLAACGNSGIRI